MTTSAAKHGALSGMSMVWTDDLEGMIGQGEQFDAASNTLGDHTVTLTATDADADADADADGDGDGDGNIGVDSITFAIVP